MLRKAFARAPFDGEGAYLYGGRWSSVGTRLSYASEHQSLAMLEYFVHLDSDDAPPDLVLVTAEIPDDLPRHRIAADKLPTHWRRSPAPPELARIGDEFVQNGRALRLDRSIGPGSERKQLAAESATCRLSQNRFVGTRTAELRSKNV